MNLGLLIPGLLLDIGFRAASSLEPLTLGEYGYLIPGFLLSQIIVCIYNFESQLTSASQTGMRLGL